MTIFVEDSFDSAHWLPHVPEGHKCRRLHGHTYRIRLEIGGAIGDTSGWIIDYSEVKARWDHVKDQLDHRCLNDVLQNPTCELLVEWIAGKLQGDLALTRIELRETERCGVVWQP